MRMNEIFISAREQELQKRFLPYYYLFYTV